MCNDFFRPGSFPPAGDQEANEAPNGTAGGSAEVANGGDSSGDVAGSGDGAALRQAMLRADYVNSLNAFNQLPVSRREQTCYMYTSVLC